MDSIITALVILVISAIAAWMKKTGKPEGGRDGSGNQPPPQPQPRTGSWEAELRRLLEGESEAETPQRPVRRPPVVIAQPPPIHAPPVAKPVPVARPLPHAAPKPVVIPTAQPVRVEVPGGELAHMTESRHAYERASKLEVAVSEHMGRVTGERVKATAVIREKISPEAASVVALFKNPRTVRQAVLASIILGPPKSLQEAPATLF